MTLIQLYLLAGVATGTAYVAWKLYDGGIKSGDFIHMPIETGAAWLVAMLLWPFVIVAWWLEHNER